MNLSIFSDFDNTISIGDIGNKLFIEFGKFYQYVEKFNAGDINTRQLNLKLCNSIPKNTPINELNKFASEQEIDFYFPDFINFCKDNSYKFHIVSDGYDIYINKILEKYNLSYLPKFCNNLVKTEAGFGAIFFDANESCSCTTASCKRNVVLNNSADEDIIVYIGDGMTDFCAAEHSDIIFAKSDLAKHCQQNKIPYHPFKSFFDIRRILGTLAKTKKLKQRNQAFLKRKSAFEAE